MKFLFALFSILTIVSPYASAQWKTSGSATLTSQYVSPALSVSNDQAVIQPNLHFSKNDGYYIDLFGTFGLAKSKNNEFDLSVGKVVKFGTLTITSEVAGYFVLQPDIEVFASSINFQNENGWNFKAETRSVSGQSMGYHLSVGYTSDWWSTEIQKVYFYGDDITVARFNFSHKVSDDLTAVLTLATALGDSSKKTALLSFTKTF